MPAKALREELLSERKARRVVEEERDTMAVETFDAIVDHVPADRLKPHGV